MIKLSKLSDYAIVILGALAVSEAGKMTSASSLAHHTGLPEPTVAKILKLLGKERIVVSHRGASGGYTLQHDIQDISVYDVLKAIEGPMALAACVEGSHDDCSIAGTCPINGRWNMVNKAMRTALQSISLADMIAPQSCSKPINKISIDEMRV